MSNQNTQAALNKALIDKFRLVFIVPPALRKINKKLGVTNQQVDQDTIQFSIYGTVIPEIKVPATEIRYSGSTLYNSSHSRDSYPPNDVKFNIDNEFKNYWVIWKWLDLLHDEKTGIFDQQDLRNDDTYIDYMTDMEIQGLDEFNEPKLSWVFSKSFPITLGNINYNYQEDGQIPCSFSFAYSQIHVKRLGVQ